MLDWDKIDQRCAELGAETTAAKARLLGAGRAQIYRWRDGTNDIGLARAADIARRLGFDLVDIVAMANPPSKPPQGPRPPAGPQTPPPPAGPKTKEAR